MSDARGLQDVLAALGQPEAEASVDNPWAPAPAADADVAEPAAKPRRRWLRWLIIVAVVLVGAGAAYWQREPLLTAAERLPLIGSVVREWRSGAGATPRPSPEQTALAERERALAQREFELAQAEAELAERELQIEWRERELAAREQQLAEQEALLEARLPGPGIDEVVAIYRNMKADAAADRIARLDNLTAITVLKRVEREHAARILAAMEAGRAAELSQALADEGPDL